MRKVCPELRMIERPPAVVVLERVGLELVSRFLLDRLGLDPKPETKETAAAEPVRLDPEHPDVIDAEFCET